MSVYRLLLLPPAPPAAASSSGDEGAGAGAGAGGAMAEPLELVCAMPGAPAAAVGRRDVYPTAAAATSAPSSTSTSPAAEAAVAAAGGAAVLRLLSRRQLTVRADAAGRCVLRRDGSNACAVLRLPLHHHHGGGGEGGGGGGGDGLGFAAAAAVAAGDVSGEAAAGIVRGTDVVVAEPRAPPDDGGGGGGADGNDHDDGVLRALVWLLVRNCAPDGSPLPEAEGDGDGDGGDGAPQPLLLFRCALVEGFGDPGPIPEGVPSLGPVPLGAQDAAAVAAAAAPAAPSTAAAAAAAAAAPAAAAAAAAAAAPARNKRAREEAEEQGAGAVVGAPVAADAPVAERPANAAAAAAAAGAAAAAAARAVAEPAEPAAPKAKRARVVKPEKEEEEEEEEGEGDGGRRADAQPATGSDQVLSDATQPFESSYNDLSTAWSQLDNELSFDQKLRTVRAALDKTESGSDDSGLFIEFTQLCASLLTTTKYTAKTEMMQDFMRDHPDPRDTQKRAKKDAPPPAGATPVDLYLLCRFLMCRDDRRIFGVKDRMMAKHMARLLEGDTSGRAAALADQISREATQFGDLGPVLEARVDAVVDVARPEGGPSLTLAAVNAFLTAMHNTTSHDEQLQLLELMFWHKPSAGKPRQLRASGVEWRWLWKLMLKDLKVSIGPKYVLAALAGGAPTAFTAYQAVQNLELVVERRRRGELADLVKETKKAAAERKAGGSVAAAEAAAAAAASASVRCFQPIKPMLARQVKTAEECANHCPNGMVAEIKYDGERLQLHYDGKQFRFFSRALKNVTPWKTQHVSKCVWERGGRSLGGEFAVFFFSLGNVEGRTSH